MSEINQSTNQSSELKSDVPTPSNSAGNKLVFIIGGILVILAVLFGMYKAGIFGEKTALPGDMLTSADPDKVVATVNGIKITRAELDEKIAQVKKTLPAGAVDPTEDAAFELQLLNDLVSLKLLTAVAEEKRYTVTDEQIAAERAALVEQLGGEETFSQQLQALEISEEELKTNMRNELLIRQLLDEETDIKAITVSDAEIQEAYTSIIASEGMDASEAPPLEEVSEMLRAEVVNQKSSLIIEKYLEDLKAGASIELSL
jgi:FKBP-type peptidyl-prolyl cis-trans isomerase (trigger factor)